ncbi:MAG: hypothetical protein WC795_00940 [Candidatus Paceibacterota bacterium]
MDPVQILGKLFGSLARVKVMRLFLLSPDMIFDAKEISTRSRVARTALRKEINALEAMGFIKAKSFYKEIENSRSKKITKKKMPGWFLNHSFPYLTALQALLIDAEFLKKEDLADRFKSVGKIKLLVAAGIFIQDPDSRVDLLIVGDNIKRSHVEQAVKGIEAEIGKEISYAMFETQDFIYRLNMYDKLVRDIFDFPHEKIIDLGKFTGLIKKS